MVRIVVPDPHSLAAPNFLHQDEGITPCRNRGRYCAGGTCISSTREPAGEPPQVHSELSGPGNRRLLSVFQVTSTGDNGGVDPAAFAGTGTFRQAIIDSNATAGSNTIDFSIGTGMQTISLQAALPAVSVPVLIDGTSQPGYAGQPLIVLDGTNAGASAARPGHHGGVEHRDRPGHRQLQRRQRDLSHCAGGDLVTGCYLGTDPTVPCSPE